VGGSQIALGESERGAIGHSDAIQGQRSAVHRHVFFFCPPLGACLQQGGEGGVNISGQRLECSVMFTPSPLGTFNARPADLSGQLQSR
jgi:hypothetical protein